MTNTISLGSGVGRIDNSQIFVDGDWTDPDGAEVYTVIEAATEEVIGRVALGNQRDITRAVDAARSAVDDGPWSRMGAEERADLITAFADELERHADETSTLVSRENGMPISLSRVANGSNPASVLRMYADMAVAASAEEVRASAQGATIVRREPVGVVGAITPWNSPQTLAAMKIAPALAMGCTVVLKPSPETSLDAKVIGDSARAAGIPAGVINIVPGDRDAGAALVSAPHVDKVSFTGSTAAGRTIAAECGRLIRPCTLELGGKSASIVLDDVDLDSFVRGLPNSSFRNNGQICALQTRILAPKSRYDEIVEAVVSFARGIVVGNPLDPAVQCGPMVSEAHRERVLGHIRGALARGANAVTGGGTPSDQPRGWFVEPTVFTGIDNSDPIAQQEVFGPVVVVIPYADDDDAVRIANDSEYGLGGSVWTTDEERGITLSRRVRTGTIGVNYYALDSGSPFGGMKNSGLGRELGPEGLEAYCEYKSIYAGPDAGRHLQ